MNNLTKAIRMERTSTNQGAFTVAVSEETLQKLKIESDVVILWERDLKETDKVNLVTHEIN